MIPHDMCNYKKLLIAITIAGKQFFDLRVLNDMMSHYSSYLKILAKQKQNEPKKSQKK